MKKYILILFFILLMCVGCSKEVNEACDWCGSSPSVAYKTSNGTTCHVCKNCSSTCMLCGSKKASKHYTNALDLEVFVCNDCYKELQQ